MYALTWHDSLKIVLSVRIRQFKKNDGRENEENVARTRK